VTEFWALLGGDFSGKSETLRALAAEGWQVVSYDDPYLHRVPVIRELRSRLFFDAYCRIGREYSPKLVFSLLTPIVWYLRDEALRQAERGPTLVDSYYFKLLAKGIVSDIADAATIALWRSFPPPRGVLFLDVDPHLAWHRAGGAAGLNPFEHYGTEATCDSFISYQRDLRAAMLYEVQDLDVVVVDANRSPDLVTMDVRAALRAGLRRLGGRTT
jgi:thymidylate kinase